MSNIQCTIVFQKIWKAVHEMSYNEDGHPIVDDLGRHERKYKYIILRGSSRSSKTFSIIDVLDLYAREQNSKRITAWRDTKTDCVKTVLNDVVKRLKTTGRYRVGNDFNKTVSIFTYTTDSTLEIHGTDDEITVHGLNQNVAWLNEPYKISRDVFDQIDQRTEDFILLDINPKMGHWYEDVMKDKKAIVIDSTFKDNPFCPPEQRRKILSYQPVKMCALVESKKLKEQEANEYDIILNPNGYTLQELSELSMCIENERKRSASEFNWSVYGLGLKSEKPHRIFKWNKIPLSEYLSINTTIYNACDWGAVDPWAVLEAKYYDGTLYLRELNYSSENEIRGKLTVTELAQINSSDEGIVKWKFGKLGIGFNNVIICDNNRPSKIRALRAAGWEYALAAAKGTGSKIDGIDVLNNVQVCFTDDSTSLEYEQENYSRKVDRYGIVLEEPEDIDDHLMDAARYIALYLQDIGVISKI